MYLMTEDKNRRNLSLDAKTTTKDLTLNQNFNTKMRKSNSYYKERSIPLGNVYTSICKNFYPLIMKVDYGKIKQRCNKHYKIFSFYCFTCQIHFCNKCQCEHFDHSFISFDEIEINDTDIIKEKSLVKNRISLLFKEKINEKTDKKTYEKLMNLKDEIIKFNYFVIGAYKKDKNNFYNFYNYYYLYKLKEDLKSDRNDLLKKYFGLYGFKKIINNLEYFYEKQKYKWLLKNLINYKKNEIRKEKLKKREKAYRFENLDLLIQNEGFNENITNKMKEIITEVKNRDDLKKKYLNLLYQQLMFLNHVQINF